MTNAEAAAADEAAATAAAAATTVAAEAAAADVPASSAARDSAAAAAAAEGEAAALVDARRAGPPLFLPRAGAVSLGAASRLNLRALGMVALLAAALALADAGPLAAGFGAR